MNLSEAKLTDIVLELHAQYGGAQPRPNGSVIQFSVVDPNTTYQQAEAAIEKLLRGFGVQALNLNITPGPEVRQPFNRSVKFSILRSTLLGNVPI